MNEPMVGEIRKGIDVGQPNDPSHKYVWRPCVACGVCNWVALRRGKPTSIRCTVCSVCSRPATSRKNIGIDNKDKPPFVGEIRMGRYIGHRSQPSGVFIFHACVGCGIPRWTACVDDEPKRLYCVKCSARKRNTRPEFRAKARAAAIVRWANPEARIAQSRMAYVIGAKPEVKARRSKSAIESQSRPEIRTRKSIAMKELWASPKFQAERAAVHSTSEYKTRVHQAMKEIATRPEVRAAMGERSRRHWADPEYRAEMSQKFRDACARPEVITKKSETRARPEVAAKYRAASKEIWTRPEYRTKQSGANCPSWLGGISFEPYTSEFNNILKERIRARDNYVCQLCGKNRNNIPLVVHHVDYDKKHSTDDNLISLCTICHGRTNHNRAYWTAELQRLLSTKQLECLPCE